MGFGALSVIQYGRRVKGTRRLAITGVAVAGVLINVAIWYGIPQLLASSNADTYRTNPAATSSNEPTPSGTPGDPGDSPVDASGSPSPSASPSSSASTAQPGGGHPNPGTHPSGQPRPSATKSNAPPKPKSQTVGAEHSASSATFTYTPTSISVSPSAADGWSATPVTNNNMAGVIFSGPNGAQESIAATVQSNGTLKIDRGWKPPSSPPPSGN